MIFELKKYVRINIAVGLESKLYLASNMNLDCILLVLEYRIQYNSYCVDGAF